MSKPHLRAVWFFENDPRLAIFADANAEGWRASIHVKSGFERPDGDVCERENWHGLARLSYALV
jgi:hypothetical protein